MKRIITLTAIALGLSSGVALADHRGGWRGGRSEIRDHRYDRPAVRTYNDNNRGWNRRDRNTVRVERVRPTFRNNRFYFAGGTYRTYNRPVINAHYRDYYSRPALIVENYDPVDGYVWSAGTWEWNGYEWNWIAGHYEVDSGYHQHAVAGDDYNTGYDDQTYNQNYNQNYDQNYDQDDDQNYYNQNYDRNYTPAPVYNSGVTVQGHINF